MKKRSFSGGNPPQCWWPSQGQQDGITPSSWDLLVSWKCWHYSFLSALYHAPFSSVLFYYRRTPKWACKNFDKVQQKTDWLVEQLSEQPIDVARYRWNGRADNKSVKAVRTTILLDGPPCVVVEMVDHSIYVLNRMHLNVLFVNSWFEAYGLSERMGNGALQTVCLKRCNRMWFKERKPSPLAGACLSQWNTSSMEAVKQLNSSNVY